MTTEVTELQSTEQPSGPGECDSDSCRSLLRYTGQPTVVGTPNNRQLTTGPMTEISYRKSSGLISLEIRMQQITNYSTEMHIRMILIYLLLHVCILFGKYII